ncbi:MAG: cupin domain-containing protein [Candidatus Sumerlaeia bacterium]
MKRYRLKDLQDVTDGHFLKGILDGEYICMGGMGFKKPGVRTHTNDGPDGRDYHVHGDDCEAFVILQGKAQMELDGELIPLQTGDIMVIEPGEDHHLISDKNEPCINLWLHAGPKPHPDMEVEQ